MPRSAIRDVRIARIQDQLDTQAGSQLAASGRWQALSWLSPLAVVIPPGNSVLARSMVLP
jgi:hypothetical protein